MIAESPSTSDAMTIHQLAERSGVPPRRIRHYIAQDLLPPAIGRGRAAHYARRHLDRLRQVEALRDVNLGLDEIRRRLGSPIEVRSPGATGVEVQSWRHYQIVPGVELHVRADLEQVAPAMIRVLTGVARELLARAAADEERVVRDDGDGGSAGRG